MPGATTFPLKVWRNLGRWAAGLVAVLPCLSGAVERSALPTFLLRSWDSEDGLPSASVRALAHTPDGYLWIATARGLAQFDGMGFVALQTNQAPALGDDRVTCLLTDRAGQLWAGTEGGALAVRRSNGFAAVPLPSRMRGVKINALAQAGDGAIWVATQQLGLGKFQDDRWEFSPSTNALLAQPVTSVVADRSGRIWAIAGARLLSFHDGRWEVPPVRGLGALVVVAIAPSRDGSLWIATSAERLLGDRTGARILELKDGQWARELTPYPWPQDTFHTQVRALLEDRSGRVWIGMMGAGVYYREPGNEWQPLGPQTAFSQILVSTLAEDDSGNLWVGLDGAQLDQVRPRVATMLHLPAAANQHVVRMVCARRDGSLWLGTDGAGVFSYAHGGFTEFAAEAGLTNGYLGAIFEDRSTNLWVGTWAGLYRLEGKHFERVPGPAPLSGVIRAICQDADGSLWVGTSAGVVRVAGNQTTVLGATVGLPAGQVLALQKDTWGALWVSVSSRGLYHQTGDRFERVPIEAVMGQTETSALLADAEGGMWIGSLSQGLTYWKNETRLHWTRQDGLPSDGIRSLIEDDQGRLWCSSDAGIFGCPKARLRSYRRGESPLICWRVSVAEGLDTPRCSGIGQPVAARAPDGRLWFPNWRALAVFNPEDFPRRALFWPIVIEPTVVDGVVQPADASGRLRIPSSTRRLEFHYTSPNLQAPERVRFRYRLDGLDEDWLDAAAQRVAYYHKLAPATYRFRVMAGGPDGEWREASQPIVLEVVPSLWERPAVRAAAGLGLLGGFSAILWSAARARLRRRVARLERQQALERERSRIARDMHDEIGARLTQISLLSDLANTSASDPAEVKTQTGKLSHISRDLTRSLDEIVWAVRPQNDNLESLVDYLADALRDLCDASGMRFWFSGPGTVPVVEVPSDVRHNVLLACFEVVNNALKHSGGDEVRLSLRLEGSRGTIEITDNGSGFDVVKGKAKRSGLHHLRQRLGEIGGTCRITSEPGHGTQTTLTFPLGQGETAYPDQGMVESKPEAL